MSRDLGHLGRRHFQQPRHFTDALSLIQRCVDASDLHWRHRRAAKTLAIDIASTVQARWNAISDHRPLELTKSTEHPEQGATRWRAGVERLLVHIQIDAACLKLPRRRRGFSRGSN
jgi:hypothetical protein